MSLWRFKLRHGRRAVHATDVSTWRTMTARPRATMVCGRDFYVAQQKHELLIGLERAGLTQGRPNGEPVSCEGCIDELRGRIRDMQALLEGRR